MADRKSQPQYSRRVVAGVALLEVIENPAHLTVSELATRIVANLDDRAEMDTALQSISDLHRSSLVRFGSDDKVEPTEAAVQARDYLDAASGSLKDP